MLEPLLKKGRKPSQDARRHKLQGYLTEDMHATVEQIIAHYQEDLGHSLSNSDIVNILILREAERLGLTSGQQNELDV